MNDQHRNEHREDSHADPALGRMSADLDAVGRGLGARASEGLESRLHAASVDRLAEPMPVDLLGIAAALDDLAFVEAGAPDRLAESVFAASLPALASAGKPAARADGRPVVAGSGSGRVGNSGVLARIGELARSRTVRIAAAVALLVAGAAAVVQVRNERARDAQVRALAASVDGRLDELFSMLEVAETSETADAGEHSDEAMGLDEFLRSLEGRL